MDTRHIIGLLAKLLSADVLYYYYILTGSLARFQSVISGLDIVFCVLKIDIGHRYR